MEPTNKPAVPAKGNTSSQTEIRTPQPHGAGMNRKTKIGLVVAASFLTLVGGIIGVKQLGRPTAGATEEKQLAQNNPPPAERDPFNVAPEHAPRQQLDAGAMLIGGRRKDDDVPATSIPDLPKMDLPKLDIPPEPIIPVGGQSDVREPLKTDRPMADADPPKIDIPKIDFSELGAKDNKPMKDDSFRKPRADEPTIPKLDIPKLDLPSLDEKPSGDSGMKIDIPKIDEPAATKKDESKIEIPRIDDPPIEEKKEKAEPKRLIITIPPKKDNDRKQEEQPKLDIPKIEIPSIDRDGPMPREGSAPKVDPLGESGVKIGPIEPGEAGKSEPKREPAPQPLPPASVSRDGGYDEDLHQASRNETYQAISKRFYEDESYAAALQQYNRDNPGGGGYVRVPPIEVLMKRYPNAAPKGGVRPASGAAPASLNVTTERDPSRSPVSPVASYPVYTVPESGETLRDIATKTLGNADHWRAIHELNISVNPNEKLAGGTRLRMPPQARVQQ